MKGTVFTEVDMNEGEWSDYDEKVCSFPPDFVILRLMVPAGSITSRRIRNREPVDEGLRRNQCNGIQAPSRYIL